MQNPVEVGIKGLVNRIYRIVNSAGAGVGDNQIERRLLVAALNPVLSGAAVGDIKNLAINLAAQLLTTALGFLQAVGIAPADKQGVGRGLGIVFSQSFANAAGGSGD